MGFFFGVEGEYSDILSCFERVGIEMRKEINDYLTKFNKLKTSSRKDRLQKILILNYLYFLHS